jgi:hypothetical protein
MFTSLPHFPSTRIFYELLSRDREDGRATWQPYRGIGSEAYPNGTSQEPTAEDAREGRLYYSRSLRSAQSRKRVPSFVVAAGDS